MYSERARKSNLLSLRKRSRTKYDQECIYASEDNTKLASCVKKAQALRKGNSNHRRHLFYKNNTVSVLCVECENWGKSRGVLELARIIGLGGLLVSPTTFVFLNPGKASKNIEIPENATQSSKAV